MREMMRDGLLSVPSTVNPKKGVRRRKVGEIMNEFSKTTLPSSYLSFALGPGNDGVKKGMDGEGVTVEDWTGPGGER